MNQFFGSGGAVSKTAHWLSESINEALRVVPVAKDVVASVKLWSSTSSQDIWPIALVAAVQSSRCAIRRIPAVAVDSGLVMMEILSPGLATCAARIRGRMRGSSASVVTQRIL